MFALADVVQVALVVAMSSVLAPVVLAAIMNRSNRHGKLIDWARQDEVADRAEKAAAAIVEANRKTTLATEHTAMVLGEVKDQGTITHALVNSDKTSGLQRELALLEATRAAQRSQRAMGRRLDSLIPPDAEAQEVDTELFRSIEAADKRIAELTLEIADRLKAQRTAEEQIAVAKLLAPHGMTPANADEATILVTGPSAAATAAAATAAETAAAEPPPP